MKPMQPQRHYGWTIKFWHCFIESAYSAGKSTDMPVNLGFFRAKIPKNNFIIGNGSNKCVEW